MSQQLSEHRARSISTWTDWRKKDVSERIGPAPEVLLDYLRLDNQLNGSALVPQPAREWKPFADEIVQAIDEFPAEVKQQLIKHVLGIFLVTNLGSTGYTEAVVDVDNHPLGIIILDTHALDKKANAWATWKDNTAFRTSPGMEVRIMIEPAARDNRKNAIAYILLHELGHVVGLAGQAHAYWWVQGNPADYPFSSLSWLMRDGALAAKWDDTFPDRNKVRFYAGEKAQLPADKIPAIYADLEKTDFVSLYAATGIHDDFAETYAMYVHVVLQKRPWQLSVLRDGKPVLTMAEPIQQERCEKKRKYLASLFGEVPGVDEHVRAR